MKTELMDQGILLYSYIFSDCEGHYLTKCFSSLHLSFQAKERMNINSSTLAFLERAE